MKTAVATASCVDPLLTHFLEYLDELLLLLRPLCQHLDTAIPLAADTLDAPRERLNSDGEKQQTGPGLKRENVKGLGAECEGGTEVLWCHRRRPSIAPPPRAHSEGTSINSGDHNARLVTTVRKFTWGETLAGLLHPARRPQEAAINTKK